MRYALSIIVFILAALLPACNSRPSRVAVGIGLHRDTHAVVELATKEINAAGGIGGVPLELVGLEWKVRDLYDPIVTLDWANRFAQTKDLLAVIGHGDSVSTLTAAATYNHNGIPQIVTIATNPAITNIGVWTYRLCLSDAAQGPALAEYAVKEWGKRHIAIFYVNDDYGRGLAHLFEKRVQELGAEVIASIIHRNLLQPDDQELIHSTLAGMKKSRAPDLIVLFQRVAAAGWTIKAIDEAGITVDKLGGDNLAQYGLIQENPVLTEGMRVSQFFHLDPDNPRAVQFARHCRESTGFEPDYSQAFAYDAVYLLHDAILNGGYHREGVKAYLDHLIQQRIPVQGVTGSFTLGPDHDARRSFYIAEIRGGGFQVIKALPVN